MEQIIRNLCLLLFASLSISLTAQEKSVLTNFSPQFNPCQFPEPWERDFRVSFWISADPSGDTGGYTQAECQQMIDEVNAVFGNQVDTEFDIFKVTTMFNFQFMQLSNETEEVQMTSMYHHVGSINIYLLDDIDDSPPLVESGYAFLPPNPRDVIIIRKEDFVPGNKRIFHLLGHFFGLLDTYSSDAGVELVDGSNCDVAGDMICDTSADIEGGVNVATSCNFGGPIFQDPAGSNYYPPTDNFMSEYNDDCKCKYSIFQYQRMYTFYNTFRTELW